MAAYWTVADQHFAARQTEDVSIIGAARRSATCDGGEGREIVCNLMAAQNKSKGGRTERQRHKGDRQNGRATGTSPCPREPLAFPSAATQSRCAGADSTRTSDTCDNARLARMQRSSCVWLLSTFSLAHAGVSLSRTGVFCPRPLLSGTEPHKQTSTSIDVGLVGLTHGSAPSPKAQPVITGQGQRSSTGRRRHMRNELFFPSVRPCDPTFFVNLQRQGESRALSSALLQESCWKSLEP